MGLPFSAPNNGTLGLLRTVLRNPVDYEELDVTAVPQCAINMSLQECGKQCPPKDYVN